MTALADHLVDRLTERLGLETNVKPPKMRTERNASDLVTAKLRISIVTQPGTPNLPQQRIHLEICNVPSYDNELLPVCGNYDLLPASLKGMTIRVETGKEILADKLVAFPAALSKHPRWRDLWDLHWLRAQSVGADAGLVRRKVGDYRLVEFDRVLGVAVEKIQELVECRDFVDQMGRFLDRHTVERTVGAWLGASLLRGISRGSLKACSRNWRPDRIWRTPSSVPRKENCEIGGKSANTRFCSLQRRRFAKPARQARTGLRVVCTQSAVDAPDSDYGRGLLTTTHAGLSVLRRVKYPLPETGRTAGQNWARYLRTSISFDHRFLRAGP